MIKIRHIIALLISVQVLLFLECGMFPSSPDTEHPKFSLTFQFGKIPSPNLAGTGKRHAGLSKVFMPDTVDRARIMVIDNSAYVLWEDLTATNDWAAYTLARDSWSGDLGLWNEWIDLIDNHFSIISNTTLDIENGQATGNVAGAIGLNSIVVCLEDGGRIRYWGETRATGVADSTRDVVLLVEEHFYFGGEPDTTNGPQDGEPVFEVAASIPVGTNPLPGVLHPDGSKLYVANVNSTDISVISTDTRAVTNTIETDSNPFRPVITPDGRFLYVVHNEGGIHIISTESETILNTLNIRDATEDPVISGDGAWIYIANSVDNEISVISTGQQSVMENIPMEFSPDKPAISPAGDLLLVTHGARDKMSFISTETLQVTRTVDLEDLPTTPVFSSSGEFWLVPHINQGNVWMMSSDSTADVIFSSQYGALTPAITSDDHYAFIPNIHSDNIAIIDLYNQNVLDFYSVGVRPRTPAVDPNDDYVYVPNSGSGSVSVFSVESLSLTATVPVGDTPDTPVIAADGKTVYVSNYLDNTVSVIEIVP